MFVYGKVEEKKPKEAALPEKSTPPPPQEPRYKILGEVEYYRNNLQFCIIRILLFLQIPLYIIIFACHATLLAKFKTDIALIVTGAASGVWGFVLFFLEATIFSFLTLRKPKGVMLGLAMAWQTASAVVACLVMGGSIVGIVKAWTIRYTYYYPKFPFAPIPAYEELSNEKNWGKEGFPLFILISAVSVFYILSCIFVSIFLCGGACCASLSEKASQESSGGTAIEIPKDSETGGDSANGIAENKDEKTGFYLNKYRIKIVTYIQLGLTELLMIFLLVKTAVFGGDYLSFICFLWPLILFTVASGLTLIAIRTPTGCTVGSALGFQSTSAVIGTFIGIRSIILLSFGKDYKGGIIAIHVLMLLDAIALVSCCIINSIQFTRVSCCGRYKVNQSGYGDIELRVRID